jgi:hypothetical protein
MFAVSGFFIASCTDKRPPEAPLSRASFEIDYVTYEGRVLLDTSTYLEIAVKLKSSTDTEGSYLLSETVTKGNHTINSWSINGFYSVLGDSEGRPLLILQNSSLETPLRRHSVTSNGRVREENFRNTDLRFYVLSDALQVLDNDQVISTDPEHFLYKKRSPTFTVEGYFSYRGDTSFFYETNTRQNWPITKLGVYHQAAWEHNTLARKKNDTTYLKATAYCVKAVNKSRQAIDALVLKKILQSSSR